MLLQRAQPEKTAAPNSRQLIGCVQRTVHSPFCCLAAKLCLTSWTVDLQTPLSMGFPWQEYWSGLPFPSPGALPISGIRPNFPALAGGFFITEPPRKPMHSSSCQQTGQITRSHDKSWLSWCLQFMSQHPHIKSPPSLGI